MADSTLLSNLKKSLDSFKSQTLKMHETLKQIRQRIDALTAERAALQERPLTKGDWLSLCLAHVDNMADQEAPRFAERVIGRASDQRSDGKPSANIGLAQLFSRENATISAMPVFCFNHLLPGDPLFDEGFAYFLFRDAIKAAILKAFDESTADWLYPDAEPCAALLSRLDAIDAEIAELKQQEQEIVEHTSALGLSV